MTELRALLEERQIRKAAVIDDVFDDAPRPDDLDSGDWATFFDDLGNDDHDTLETLFPGFKSTDASDLQESQDFIDFLWNNRQNLPARLIETLFQDYENTNAIEKAQLESLVQILEGLGLTCERIGREASAEADDADLIVIDLFLGRNQTEGDMERAIERARDLVAKRAENPPLVILTSKSPRLDQNRDAFRDDAGLLGSTFRMASKSDLGKEGALEAMLLRLALHYEDAKRVAGFVHAWDSGLGHARENFIRLLRRLDLSDLAQVRALLLDFEGERLGEYLLDVADRVLQHEIEDDDDTIAAALELNKIDLEKYPAPHLTGTSDLQDLVHRMVFLHTDRLRLSEDDGMPVLQFGDVLRWKKEGEDVYGNNVCLVVTPACDLVRGGAERVMLLAGRLEELQPKDWSYKGRPAKTAIIILPEEGRRWIKWDLKDVRTVDWEELDGLLGDGQRLSRIGRLREIYALEIQEMLLADLGRIGRPANMPVPFPVSVSFFYVGTDSTTRDLGIQDIESAACYVGRDQDANPVHRLVLTEQACDQIEHALQTLEENAVLNSARPSLAAVKDDQGFFTRFGRGEIYVSPEKGTKYIKGRGNQTYGAIMRGEKLEEGIAIKGDAKKAAIIVNVMDISEEGSL